MLKIWGSIWLFFSLAERINPQDVLSSNLNQRSEPAGSPVIWGSSIDSLLRQQWLKALPASHSSFRLNSENQIPDSGASDIRQNPYYVARQSSNANFCSVRQKSTWRFSTNHEASKKALGIKKNTNHFFKNMFFLFTRSYVHNTCWVLNLNRQTVLERMEYGWNIHSDQCLAV